MGGSSNSNVGCNGENASVTPYQKQMLLKPELQSLKTDLPPSSDGDNSCVASMNEGCESPLSSWDSETDIPSLINCDGMSEGSLQSINLEENYLDMEEQNQFVRVENSDDGLLWEMDNRSYDDLLKKFMEKEDELRFSNFRLQLLEQENINLKVLVENCEVQLDNAIKESKLKEEELHKQTELSEYEIFKLNIEIEESENQLENMQEELNWKEEELQNLSKIKTELTSKLEDCESRNKELENKLRQYEAKKLKQEELHAAKQKFLQDEIISLVEDHGPRMEMVKIELEKANNMIDYLETEICSRNDKISNMKKYTDDVKISLKELMVEYNTALNEVNNLKPRVGELEKEVTRQNGVISDMADEKKEAIRQLHKVNDQFERILQN